MKIYGDTKDYPAVIQEPGIIFGHNDVLVENVQQSNVQQISHCKTTSFFGSTHEAIGSKHETITTQPKVYLHTFNSFWSSLTGTLRQYCLPWRWKVAYLDKENNAPPERILVCTSGHNRELSNRLNAVIGQSPFVINLKKNNRYKEILGQEYLRIPSQNNESQQRTIITRSGSYFEHNNLGELFHIHRIRGVFSLLNYHLLKNLSSEWEEVAIQADQFSENVLIGKKDRTKIEPMPEIKPTTADSNSVMQIKVRMSGVNTNLFYTGPS